MESFRTRAAVFLFLATLAAGFGTRAQQPAVDVRLDPAVFDPLLGTYQFPDGRLLVIARTERRLFAYEPDTGRIRGLERIDDRTWVAGPSLLVSSPPAWRGYRGPVLGIFGELDAQTPVAAVVPRFAEALASRRGGDFTISVFARASHLMLEATRASDDELEHLQRVVPGFYDLTTDWLSARRQRMPSK